MSWVWVAVFLGLVWLAGVVLYYLSQRPQASPDTSSAQPRYPSVVVEMDDQPPVEIDFEAGIRANRQSKHPSQEEAG